MLAEYIADYLYKQKHDPHGAYCGTCVEIADEIISIVNHKHEMVAGPCHTAVCKICGHRETISDEGDRPAVEDEKHCQNCRWGHGNNDTTCTNPKRKVKVGVEGWETDPCYKRALWEPDEVQTAEQEPCEACGGYKCKDRDTFFFCSSLPCYDCRDKCQTCKATGLKGARV